MKPVRAQTEIDKVKEEILTTSLSIIVSDGLPALTMRRLAREIGMTAPNIYNYFSNKDEIYLTLMIKGFERLALSLNESMSKASTPLDRARNFMVAYLRFGIENSSYYEVMFTSRAPKHRDYVGTIHEALSTKEHAVSMSLAALGLKVIQALAEERDSDINLNHTKLIMTTLWSLLHGMVGLHISQNIGYIVDDADTLYASIVDNVIKQVDHLFDK